MTVQLPSNDVSTSIPDIQCVVCGAPGRPWRNKRGYEILRCPACNNAFVRRDLVPPDLEALYSAEYFQGGESTGYPSYLADAPLLTRNFADRMSWIIERQPPGNRLLEIGCAYGFFLRAATRAGFDATGVELAGDCVSRARQLSGARVLHGDVLTTDVGGPFDVVALFDVIEHLRDPVACLRRGADLLAPGGLLVVETGDVDAPWARVLGDRWYFLDPPQHLVYFSESGLRRAALEAGLTGPVSLRRIGRRVSLANISFKLAKAIGSDALRRRVITATREHLKGSIYLNFGDGMLVAIRKGNG